MWLVQRGLFGCSNFKHNPFNSPVSCAMGLVLVQSQGGMFHKYVTPCVGYLLEASTTFHMQGWVCLLLHRQFRLVCVDIFLLCARACARQLVFVCVWISFQLICNLKGWQTLNAESGCAPIKGGQKLVRVRASWP